MIRWHEPTGAASPRFALRIGVSDLGINSSLLLATSDLNLVQMITRAMRTVDQSNTAAGSPAATSSPVRVVSPSVVQNQFVRNSKKPAATYEPCKIHHWHTRPDDLQPYSCNRPVLSTDCKTTIQAPWKVLPWPTKVGPVRSPGQRVIKVISSRADEGSVGRTLDLFV